VRRWWRPSPISFVRFNGDAAGPVQFITLRGLRFSTAATPCPRKVTPTARPRQYPRRGHGRRRPHLTLEDCELAHTGIYGVWFRRGVENCRVSHCYLHDLGAAVCASATLVNDNPPPADRNRSLRH